MCNKQPTDPISHTRSVLKSSALEVTLVILLVALLLAGTVLLFNRGVRKASGVTGNRRMDAEASRVLSGIERMVENSERTGLRYEQMNGRDRLEPAIPAIDILADLDGDFSSGGFSADGTGGLERVLVFRSPKDGRTLIARVYADSDAEPDDVVLTSMLDGGDPAAFQVKLVDEKATNKLEGARSNPALEVTVKMKVDGEMGTFSRLLPLD